MICMHAEDRLLLDQVLDFKHGGVPHHLGRIADSMDTWEGAVAEELGLTTADIACIKTENQSKLNLQV